MSTSEQEPRAAGEQYWVDRAASVTPEKAVLPDGRIMRYNLWKRRMLQSWTMQRARALKPRSKCTLDIGCGFGDWTELLAQFSDEIHAFDVAPAFVEQTRQRVPQAHVTASDLRSYSLPADLDLVYAGAVFMYAPQHDVVEILQRIRAAVRPDAVVIIRDWCTFNFGRRTINSSPTKWSIHRSANELCWLAEGARFQVAEVRSSFSIYGEVMGGRLGQWPMRALWRLYSLPSQRASHTLILRPS